VASNPAPFLSSRCEHLQFEARAARVAYSCCAECLGESSGGSH